MEESGYSGTPLAKKLGLKANAKMMVYNQPKHYFKLSTDLPSSFEVSESFKPQSVDFIHLFVLWFDELKSILDAYKNALGKEGMMWISWPKGTSNLETDLKRDIIREYLLSMGLVDVKVAAIDKDWSGLKFIYRIKDRD